VLWFPGGWLTFHVCCVGTLCEGVVGGVGFTNRTMYPKVSGLSHNEINNNKNR